MKISHAFIAAALVAAPLAATPASADNRNHPHRYYYSDGDYAPYYEGYRHHGWRAAPVYGYYRYNPCGPSTTNRYGRTFGPGTNHIHPCR